MKVVNANGMALSVALLDIVLELGGRKAAFFQVSPDTATFSLVEEFVDDLPNGKVLYGRHVFLDDVVPTGTLRLLDYEKQTLVDLVGFVAAARTDLASVTVTDGYFETPVVEAETPVVEAETPVVEAETPGTPIETEGVPVATEAAAPPAEGV